MDPPLKIDESSALPEIFKIIPELVVKEEMTKEEALKEELKELKKEKAAYDIEYSKWNIKYNFDISKFALTLTSIIAKLKFSCEGLLNLIKSTDRTLHPNLLDKTDFQITTKIHEVYYKYLGRCDYKVIGRIEFPLRTIFQNQLKAHNPKYRRTHSVEMPSDFRCWKIILDEVLDKKLILKKASEEDENYEISQYFLLRELMWNVEWMWKVLDLIKNCEEEWCYKCNPKAQKSEEGERNNYYMIYDKNY